MKCVVDVNCYIDNQLLQVYILFIDLELYDILLDELFFYNELYWNMYVEEEIGI